MLKVQTIYKTMLPYCFKCRKNTESKNTKDVRTEYGRIMLFSKCAACDSKSKYITEQEASRLLSSLGIKIPLNKIPSVNSLIQGE